MLWETVEPETALRERFGFPDLTAATTWMTAALQDTWGIAVQESSRVVISGHNAILWAQSDRGPLVVKWSRQGRLFSALEASTRLLAELGAQGLPVATPIPSADGAVRVELEGPTTTLSLAVLPELAGDWLDVTDKAAVHAAGASLARIHQALGTLSGPTLAALPEDVRSLTSKGPALPECVGQWLQERDTGTAPAASARLAALWAEAPVLETGRQLVHGDFRAANILTRDQTVVAVLDFDEVRLDHPVADLAQASVYLATLFTDWGPTTPTARRALRDGYESIRPLTADEAEWLEILVLWMSLAAVPDGDDPAGWADAI